MPFDEQLARNLNSVCMGIGQAINHGGAALGAPPMLTQFHVDCYIPDLLFDIAKRTGWITVVDDFIDREYFRDQPDTYLLEFDDMRDEYRDWFLSHFADSLKMLSESAKEHEKQRKEYLETMCLSGMKVMAQKQRLQVSEPGQVKKLIDKFFDMSAGIHTQEALAIEASKRKRNGLVSRGTIRRIYHGKPKVGLEDYKIVAGVISESIPCTVADLVPPESAVSKRRERRNCLRVTSEKSGTPFGCEAVIYRTKNS